MADLVLSGNTSGAITISAPAVAGTNTITLPANTGTVITTGSSGQSIPKAALPTGSVLQTVQLQNTTYYSGTVGAETVIFSLSSITPTSSTSKIAIFTSVPVALIGTYSNYAVNCALRRGTTTSGSLIQVARIGQYQGSTANREFYTPVSLIGLDSPATTSAVTYCFTLSNIDGNPTYIVNGNSNTSNFILQEISA